MNAGPQLISAMAGSISGSLSSGMIAPARPNSSRSSRSGPSPAQPSGDVAEHALAHLGRDVRDEAVDRHAGIGRLELRRCRWRRGSRRPPCAWPPTSAATSASCLGLWQSTTTSARSASSALEATASPPSSSASACAFAASTSATSTGSPMPRASAEAMFPAPMSPSFIAARLYRRAADRRRG